MMLADNLSTRTMMVSGVGCRRCAFSFLVLSVALRWHEFSSHAHSARDKPSVRLSAIVFLARTYTVV
jgi:hypothetical protein